MVAQGLEDVDVILLPLKRETAPGATLRVQHAGPRRLPQGRQLQHPQRGQRLCPGSFVQVQRRRRRRFVDRVDPRLGGQRLAAVVVLVGDGFPARRAHGGGLVVQHHRGIGQVVEDGFQPGMKEAQPMLHPLMLAPGADRLVERIVLPRGAEFHPVGLPEPRDRSLVEDHFRGRRQFQTVQLAGGALGCGVEVAQAVQHVAKQVQPHRLGVARRVDVDDAAAQGKIAGLGHRRTGRIAHPRQVAAQRLLVDLPADPGGEARPGDGLARRQLLHRRVQCRQQHEGAGHALRQHRQRGHAPGDDLGVGRDAVIGETIPARQRQHRDIGREEAQRKAHRLHPLVVAGDVDHRPAALDQFASEKLGVEAFGGPAQQDAFSHGQYARTARLCHMPHSVVTKIASRPTACNSSR